MYQVTEEDVKLASRQNEELIDDRIPHSIIFAYEAPNAKKWCLLYIDITTDKRVAIHAVRTSFDLGDGYYTMNTPDKSDYLDLILDLADPLTQELVDRTFEKWQNSQITMGFIHPDRLGEIDIQWLQASVRRGQVPFLVSKLHKKIAQYKKEPEFFADEIKEFESLVALLQSPDVDTLLTQRLEAYYEKIRQLTQKDIYMGKESQK